MLAIPLLGRRMRLRPPDPSIVVCRCCRPAPPPLLLLFFSLLLLLTSAARSLASNNAQFVNQSVPSTMTAGQAYIVSVTMMNTGDTAWTSGGSNPYRLGSQNPQDNSTWSLGRVELPASPVNTGSQATFTFTVTAPSTPGTYNFQWRMVQEGVEWFGDFSTNVAVTVSAPPPPATCPVGATTSGITAPTPASGTLTPTWAITGPSFSSPSTTGPVADSGTPRGWAVSLNTSVTPNTFSITVPSNAYINGSTTPGYTLQYKVVSGSTTNIYSLDFNVGVNTAIVPPAEGTSNPPLPSWQDDVRPTDEGAGALSGGFGPSAGDSVDLVTGTYENHPGLDIVVRNPVGPDAPFERLYRSAQAGTGHASPGLTPGWTHNYDLNITGPSGSWGALTLTYPNGATDTLTPVLDGSGNPTGDFTVPAGAPYYGTGVASTTAGQWSSVTLTHEDESTQTFHPVTAGATTLRLDQAANQLGQTLNLSFDSAGRISAIANDAATPVTLLAFVYDPTSGLLSRINDAYNRKVLYTNATAGGATNLTQVSQLSDVSVGSPLTQWVYDYTAIAGQPYLFSVGVPDPTGGTTGMKTHPITYDTQSSTPGYVRFITDGNGNQRAYTYHPSTNGTDVSVLNSDGSPSLSWTENYVPSSRKSTGTTDAAGNSTAVAYVDSSNPTLPTTLTNENSQSAIITYSSTYHKPTQVQAPSNGSTLTTTLAYDASEFKLGRLSSAQVGSKGATTFTYYTAADGLRGLVKTVTTSAPGSVGGSSTVTTTYTYTILGNIATVVLPAPNSTSGATVTYTYNYTDDSGFTTDPATATEAIGEPLSITDPLGHAVHLRYDSRGNLIKHYDGRGVMTQFQYNTADQLTDVIYPATGMTGAGQSFLHYDYYWPGGNLKDTQFYDEAGALFREIDGTRGGEAEGMKTSGNTPQVTLNKEGMFRVTGIQDGNSNTTSHSFDNVSNLTKIQFPLGDNTQFPSLASGGYDPVGNLLKRIDGRSVTMTLTRASDDSRVTGVGYDGTFSSKSASFAYDIYGRVTSASDNAGTYAYTYDDLDEVLSVTTTYANVNAPGTNLPAQTISYTYFPDGHRATMVMPNITGASGTSSFTYTYDNAGRVTNVRAPWTGGSYSYIYDNADRLTRQTTARVVTNYGYDDKNELTSLSNSVGLISSPFNYNFTGITYDAAGNRVSATITADASGNAPSASGVYTWTYDSKDRLTGETRTCPASTFFAFSATWAYDDPGNLTTIRGVSGVSYNADNQLTAIPGSSLTYAYDNDGNPTTYASDTLTFDEEDRVLTLPGLLGGITGSFYRADGLRAYKTAGGGITTYYIYDGEQLLYELDNNGTGSSSTFEITSTYGYGAVGLAQRYERSTGHYTCFAFDPQGSVVERFGQLDTQPADVALYDAYGGIRADVSAAATGGQFTYPAQTAYSTGFGAQWGYYTDPTTRASNSDSGFILCTSRWYDPLNARWLTRDPILYNGGINVYGFVGGNPVMGADPLGLDWLDWAANFSVGAGDSLTFGLTKYGRRYVGEAAGVGDANEVINEGSGGYIAGEVTEMAVEIAASGGAKLAAGKAAAAIAERATLKGVTEAVAKEVIEKGLRKQARRILARRGVAVVGKEVDHLRPLLGHSVEAIATVQRRGALFRTLVRRTNAVKTIFPSLGYAGIANSARNLRALDHTAHMARHVRMIYTEMGVRLLVNRYTVPARALMNVHRSGAF